MIKETDDGTLYIDQTLYVAKLSQKKMIYGKKGQRLEKIIEEANKDIEEIMGRKNIILRLHVSHKKILPESDYNY